MFKKIFLIILITLVVAVFTGTWVFGLCGDIFHCIGKFFDFMGKTFDFFGWNKGMLAIGGIYV
jgi:hypothetical protein